MYVCVCAYEFSAHRGHKKASDPLELALQAGVCLQMWAVGNAFGLSVRASRALNHRANK